MNNGRQKFDVFTDRSDYTNSLAQRQAQQRVAQQRVAQQRVAQQRVAQQRVAQHRVAQQRVAQQRVAQQRIAQQRMTQQIQNNYTNSKKDNDKRAQVQIQRVREVHKQVQTRISQPFQIQAKNLQNEKQLYDDQNINSRKAIENLQNEKQLYDDQNINSRKAIENLKNKNKKIGVIITTNGNNGIFVKQCIECYLRTLPENSYIILYINESKDPITLDMKNIFPSIEIIYIANQHKEGGLTGTWNKGIDKCFENNCDIIIVSNDDILFDSSISHICLEAANLKPEDMIYFGPKSNKPGNESNNIQLGLPQNRNPVLCTYNNNLWNINGFFMVFTKSVLLANKFNEKYYFNPEYPFGGNETEWFNRFKQIGGKGVIVPRTYIYHYKLKRWRNNREQLQDSVCIYTINTGGYEGSQIYLDPKLGYDCLYYTDNFFNIYNCIKKGIIPFYVDTSNKEAKLVQRTIKTNVHDFIPENYDKSIYIDGNMSIKKSNNIKKKLRYLLNIDKDIICFDHPYRSNVLVECQEIIKRNLEKKENINNVIENFKKYQFSDNIGLSETGILIRNHKKLISFNNDWKLHIEICRRDQASFDYLLFKHKINYLRLPFSQKKMMIEMNKHINASTRVVI